jgi:hypothetical protein
LIKRKLLLPLLLSIGLFSLFAGATTASASTVGVPTETTLDACGYFVGTQTATQTYKYTNDGVTYSAEYGIWRGVDNNYSHIPVLSVSPVIGSYFDVHSKDATGNVHGIERFRSAKGNIDQTYSFSPTTGWSVGVVATNQLSFLTSNTNGHCYAGPFPRP